MTGIPWRRHWVHAPSMSWSTRSAHAAAGGDRPTRVFAGRTRRYVMTSTVVLRFENWRISYGKTWCELRVPCPSTWGSPGTSRRPRGPLRGGQAPGRGGVRGRPRVSVHGRPGGPRPGRGRRLHRPPPALRGAHPRGRGDRRTAREPPGDVHPRRGDRRLPVLGGGRGLHGPGRTRPPRAADHAGAVRGDRRAPPGRQDVSCGPSRSARSPVLLQPFLRHGQLPGPPGSGSPSATHGRGYHAVAETLGPHHP